MPIRVVTVLLVATVISPLGAEITDREVLQSIERGTEFLKAQQDKARGNWPEHMMQPGGLTALCTLALLNAGVRPDDPAVARALDYLRGIDKPQMTYSVALRTMVFCLAEPKKDMLLISQNAKWLEATQINDASHRRRGTWAYSAREGQGDNSNTQFALLALNEAERVGAKVSPRTWQLAYEYWKGTQRVDGSWGYKPGESPSGSMTCAGISSMVITSGRFSSGRARVSEDTVICCGELDDSNAVDRGLLWLGKEFSVRRNPRSGMWLLYYLYGVERVGRLTGRRFIGSHDWYREGAEFLVREQDDFRGNWRGLGAAESNPLVATSFALLFLSKGRRPVVIAKGKHGAGADWDLHAGGVPNLTREIEKKWLRELSWQTIDLKVATVEDLLEAPVLFLSGQNALELTREQRETLRAYIEQGGFIFAEACDGQGCNGTAFDNTFRELMKTMFPDSEFRLLPPDHAVWFAEGKVDPEYMRPLYGIDACCRTSIVYCPRNLSCLWELSARGREVELREKPRREIEACMQIGQNVIAYATNRVLKEKLDRPNVAVTEMGISPESRDVLIIPKLQHNGGSDDAPNSLANLMRYARQQVELRALSQRALLPLTSETLYEYPVVFTHGRRNFRWTAAERKGLARYIENGGFLFADAICASPPFAAAFRREIELAFPGQKLERIPVNHPLFSDAYGGFDLARVTLNDPEMRQQGDRLDARRNSIPPLLEGLQINGRYALIFSPYDISCALESSASLECKGYIKTDAARIGTNIILFAMQQ